MTTRVQGGTAGILAALWSGRLDPLDARLPEERDLPHLTPKVRREMDRRERRRQRWLAKRTPF